MPIALSLLGVKVYFDGYKLLNDWGDITVAGFCGIVTYIFIVYQKRMENMLKIQKKFIEESFIPKIKCKYNAHSV